MVIDAGVPRSRRILVGHSAGGHLGLWVAATEPRPLVDAVVALAPIADLTAGLMAASLALAPLRLREAGPRQTAAAVLAGLAALTWVPQKDARFLYTIAPLLIPPAAVLAAHALGALRTRRTESGPCGAGRASRRRTCSAAAS